VLRAMLAVEARIGLFATIENYFGIARDTPARDEPISRKPKPVPIYPSASACAAHRHMLWVRAPTSHPTQQ